LKNQLRRWKKIEIRESPIETTILEAIFSRGDRRLGQVLEEAHRLGARFDGWRDQFKFDLWTQAFDHCQLDFHHYLQAIDPEAILPWDLVKTGLKKLTSGRNIRLHRRPDTHLFVKRKAVQNVIPASGPNLRLFLQLLVIKIAD